MKVLLVRMALTAVLLAVGATAYAHGPGPGMDAPWFMFGKAKAQLNLNTSQQAQWDNAVAQSKASHEAAKVNFTQLNAAMQTELGKSEPDLASIAANADSVRQQNEGSRKAARDAWLALYSTFTPEQKGVVRDTIQAGFARMQARRAEHAQHAPPASPATN